VAILNCVFNCYNSDAANTDPCVATCTTNDAGATANMLYMAQDSCQNAGMAATLCNGMATTAPCMCN